MKPNTRGPNSALRHARHLLLEQGELPVGLLDPLVERSWRRSVGAGLDPVGRLGEAPHLSASELARAAGRHQELIAHAQPVMEYLRAQTQNSGSVVALSDEHGVLLSVLGDADFLNRAQRVALSPGATWNECYRGTNAVGTALAEAAPVVVHGAEHYLERNGFLTCAAAPLVAPDGSLLGVLDISGEQRSRHPHTFGLVRAGAQMIENRLFDARHGSSMRLRFHPLAEGISTIAEGVVALSEDGWIVGANQAGLKLLGLSSIDLGATPICRVLDLNIDELAAWGATRPGQPLLAQRLRGGQLFMRIEPGRHPVPSRLNGKAAPVTRQDALTVLDTGDACMRAAIERARKVLGKPIPLLLQGKSGVGKELFAQAVHRSGPRSNEAFVAVNCAALPEQLIEAELFGYSPGAYTGAKREGSPGRIREANDGTLFLDEIGDMPFAMQSLLLRVLQERRVTPLGGGRALPVDFMLICATHRDLKEEMEQGRFRADLYYRINGLTMTLPSLCQRSDFQALVTKLIEDEMPRRGVALSAALAKAFSAYQWPGNLRQLANALRTACALLDKDDIVIDWQHLPDDLLAELRRAPPQETPNVSENLRAVSDSAIRRTITAMEGNKTEAARRLGISRNTLYRRLKQSER